MDENISAEELREIGKAYFFGNHNDAEKRREGILALSKARSMGDPEAMYIIAKGILEGTLRMAVDDQQEYGLMLMRSSAYSGYDQAREFLNAYCEERYEKQIELNVPNNDYQGALVDFDGKPIKLNRKGVFTPVDAVLEYRGGKNILTLSANVMFLYYDEIKDRKLFERAICDGLRAWQGEYEVFGGQKLSVRVRITNDDNLFDNLIVAPVTNRADSTFRSIAGVVGTKKRKAKMNAILTSKRSFAVCGIRWTVNSRKLIWIQSKDGKFDDYEEIMHTTKHEFGHALGLGDLYESSEDSLKGVEKGAYTELDSYSIEDKFYNLVMCDCHGPISNNDIEMVILAFKENKMQLYQSQRLNGKISSALGKGN